jgi:hypothetical protein
MISCAGKFIFHEIRHNHQHWRLPQLPNARFGGIKSA